MAPTFAKNLINLNENNFDEFALNGRRRVFITKDGVQFCPTHARQLGQSIEISSIGYVDKKPSRFCSICRELSLTKEA